MIISFFNFNPAVVLAITTVFSVAIFFAVWLLLNVFYVKASSRLAFFNRFIERSRKKGENRLVKKYGLVGLALLVAIPLPTLGVGGGTILSWLMGMKWWSSLIAVLSGATVSNAIVLSSVFGIWEAIGLPV